MIQIYNSNNTNNIKIIKYFSLIVNRNKNKQKLKNWHLTILARSIY